MDVDTCTSPVNWLLPMLCSLLTNFSNVHLERLVPWMAPTGVTIVVLQHRESGAFSATGLNCAGLSDKSALMVKTSKRGSLAS